MILYHGTTFADWQKIKDGIKVDINFSDEKELDFGFGFYMSKKKWYARRIAKDKASLLRATGNFDYSEVRPVLLVCTVDMDSILKLVSESILIYHYKSLKYLEDVFMARYHRAGVDTIKKDFVIAPMADGNVDEVMTWYKENETSIRKILCKIRYFLPVLSTQYVVKRQDLCEFITLEKVELEV